MKIIQTILACVAAFVSPECFAQKHLSYDATNVFHGAVYSPNFYGDGSHITGSPTFTQLTVQGFNTPTNLFSGTLFLMGTNYNISTAANLGFTGVGNVPSGTATGYGELTVKASGAVVVTNPAAWFSNDGLTNRTLTNGNLGEMVMKVVPGFSTNFIFTQHWHP